jgi:hypothetical protein
MPSTRHLLSALVLSVSLGAGSRSVHAQSARPTVVAPPADSEDAETDDEGVRLGLQSGLAGGALHYGGGRTEQSLGVVIRWAPVRWFAIAATPAAARVHEPTIAPAVSGASRGGLEDLPLEATLSHGFGGSLAPTLSGGLGMTLPVADTTGGFGSGSVGYSVSIGAGLSPLPGVWTHVSAGRSLAGLSPQAAFGSGSGWADLSAGVSLTDRLSVSGGYDSDLGAVDPIVGRSTSLTGGLAVGVHGATTVHLSTGRGLSGSAPVWSLAIGIGTAFPYVNHVGAATDQLRQALGSGSHGTGGSSGSSGRGRGKP